MKILRIALVFLFFFSLCPLVSAGTKDFTRWGNLIDVAYKFTWYPSGDLKSLLKNKSDEYGKSLEEYNDFLIAELTKAGTKTESLSPESFITGKDWKMYYRLAIVQFCLFLDKGQEINLENARAVISVLSGKMEFSNVAFWYHLFEAYHSLVKKDRDTFVSDVFKLWEYVILKLEVNDVLMMGSSRSKPEMVRNLPFFYENVAHLIIRRAIFDNAMPELYPLGVIIVSINGKLKSETGYHSIVESIVERMHGLKSDCSNLNFAAAFVEATANQYDFEDEKSCSQLVPKYNLTRAYYDLAYSWANTKKGQAAILTQHMGFNNYIIRRLIDKKDIIASNAFFKAMPEESSKLAGMAMALYDRMAQAENRETAIKACGFDDKKNYTAAMHQLWDSLSKLLMMQSAYYKSINEPSELEGLHVAEGPLLQYLSFFKKRTRDDSTIVPDSAFFMAAYASKELADLYRQSSSYSTKIEINNLAFEYQLKAIELFPIDITGILQMAHQANQEGRLNLYWDQTGPVAVRFRDSQVSSMWVEKVNGENRTYIQVTKEVVPDIIHSAYFLVKLLQQSGTTGSEEDLSRKAIILTKLLVALQKNHSDESIEDALTSLANQDLGENNVHKILKSTIPEDMMEEVQSISGIETPYNFASLNNELFGTTDHVIHSYLRALYYEQNGQ